MERWEADTGFDLQRRVASSYNGQSHLLDDSGTDDITHLG